ncbi:hypothetical protein PAECIP111893_02652 [Paenibacillus plantiphilus]|uniref:Uncharacterized protein n=1 Tax=Paenibacillus plantiphilus TaxID=2905650 RepID=A0ABN8GJM7_9BACL|nr:DUF6526 family protein [Paenibacillus plantiphilus]CAH1206928.1 hypothetical protein PAECIP111893_02652 [Paenibacillus plantiphilus]
MPQQQSNTPSQSYANHKRLDPLYHFGLSLLTVASIILSLYLLIAALSDSISLAQPLLLVIFSFIAIITLARLRQYATKVQDRAIRAEEQLRHFILTGKPIDPRLSIKQIVALRFASDNEYPSLALRAAEEGLSTDAIKKSITSWRSDDYRV